jgi:thiamine biosynthesis lipoprotein
MGTAFNFVGRSSIAGLQLATLLELAEKTLQEADEIFSLYKPDSPLSKLARGEISLLLCPDVCTEIWDDCEHFNEITDGWFSAFTPEHTFDPSGLVKTWAAAKAANELLEGGVLDFAVNAGGDILLSPQISAGIPMRMGISKPKSIANDDAGVLTVIDLNGKDFRAMATSGTAERGEHIWNPKAGAGTWATELLQVSVVAKDIVTADVLATAAFAAGNQALDFLANYNEKNEGNQVEALIVNKDSSLAATPGFVELFAKG